MQVRDHGCVFADNCATCNQPMQEHASKGVLISVNMLGNQIDTDQATELAAILERHSTLKSLCGNTGSEAVLDMRDRLSGTSCSDAIMLAPEISANEALTELNISKSAINSHDGGSWLARRGATAIAHAIRANGVLEKLTFGWYDGNNEPAVLQVGMAEADLSHKNLSSAGAIIVAAWLGHKDRGTLTSLDMSDNMLCGLIPSGLGIFDLSGKFLPSFFRMLLSLTTRTPCMQG